MGGGGISFIEGCLEGDLAGFVLLREFQRMFNYGLRWGLGIFQQVMLLVLGDFCSVCVLNTPDF